MAKPNYSFAKHQRELAKKQKKEEKRQRKADAHQGPPPTDKVEEKSGPDGTPGGKLLSGN